MKKSVLFEKRFWPLFWTQFTGAMNDNIYKNALIILITYHAMTIGGLKVEQMVAMCGGIFILPFFLFSSLAGEITDNFSMSKLVRYTKLLEIIIMFISLVGFFTSNLILLLLCLFLLGTQATFFGPVKYSILPELLKDDELVEGNALVEMGTFLAILIGTITGGVLIAKVNGPLIVGGVCLITSFIGYAITLKLKEVAPVSSGKKINYNIIKSSFEIINIAKKTKSVFISILGISWFWFFGATLLSLFPHYVRDFIHGNESVVTLFLAIFSVGVAIGSLICEKLSHERLELGLVPLGSIGLSLFVLDLFFAGEIKTNHLLTISDFLNSPGSFRIIFDLSMLSIMSGFFIVPLYTFIQTRADRKERSRVIAANNILNALFMVSSALMLMILFALKLSILQVFLVLFFLNTLVAIYIYTVIPEFLLRFFCYLLVNIVYKIKTENLSNIPKEGAVVITCNHVSFVDWLILAGSVKRPMRFVMHYSFMNIPFVKFLLKDAKVIPIAGKNEDPIIMEQAFDLISKALEEEEVVCIFPEGKITFDGNLNAFRPGIEKIIAKNKVPVVALGMKGLWGSFFSRKHGKAGSNFWVIPKTFRMEVSIKAHEAIHPKELNLQHLEEITLGLIK
jgi:1-acyl-sn-glycerol-3-phosphate acyltransferase